MRRFALIFWLVCFGHMALAAPSSVWWPGWRIESSEELSQGMKYSRSRETPSYPLPLMFDGDPATAWVYSASSQEWDKTTFNSRYGVLLRPERPVIVDGLRITNGQNQSLARFLRNDRATQIRVTMETASTKVVRTFNFTDRMGRQNVSLPRHTVKSLKIEFTKIRRGTGPHNDFCISELALFGGGRKINMAMPRAVMFYDGLEGCGAAYLILRDGQMLDGVGTDDVYSAKWSANGRYVCGFNAGGGDDKRMHLWIGDVWRSRIVREIYRPDLDYEWRGNTLFVTSYDKSGFKRTIKMP